MDQYTDFLKDPQNEGAWRIGTDRILLIQRCDDGFDCTVCSEQYVEIDGGILEAPELTLSEAREEAMKLYGLAGQITEELDYGEVWEEVFETARQAVVVSGDETGSLQSVLNTQLYQKMFAEQEQFRAKLLTMPPEEILKHAYEFVTREDILLSLEYSDLSAKQAKALLQTDTPLADIFVKWEKRETDHMTDIWDTVESRANELLRQSFLATQREGR